MRKSSNLISVQHRNILKINSKTNKIIWWVPISSSSSSRNLITINKLSLRRKISSKILRISLKRKINLKNPTPRTPSPLQIIITTIIWVTSKKPITMTLKVISNLKEIFPHRKRAQRGVKSFHQRKDWCLRLQLRNGSSFLNKISQKLIITASMIIRGSGKTKSLKISSKRGHKAWSNNWRKIRSQIKRRLKNL